MDEVSNKQLRNSVKEVNNILVERSSIFISITSRIERKNMYLNDECEDNHRSKSYITNNK